MKVLFISTDRNIFDPESAAAKRMCAYGEVFDDVHIIVYTRRSSGFSKIRLSEKVAAYPTNSIFRWRYAADAARTARRVPQCDIVSVQDAFDTALAGIFISRAQRIPLQVQVHTDFLSPEFAKLSLLNRFRVWSARRALQEADCIRVVSLRIKQSLMESGYALEGDPAVLPIPVDDQNERSVASSGEHPALSRFAKTVLVVSRLEREKDVATALRAFAAAQQKDTGLLIVGDGRERTRLESLAQTLGIETSVVFLGAVPSLPYYKKADAFLLTSRYDGYGMAVMEAAQAGCPIVVTDVGVAGYELPKEAAYICAVGDVDCLARGIAETLAGGPTVAGRIAAADKAGEDVMAWSDYIGHFKDLLVGCGAGNGRMR